MLAGEQKKHLKTSQKPTKLQEKWRKTRKQHLSSHQYFKPLSLSVFHLCHLCQWLLSVTVLFDFKSATNFGCIQTENVFRLHPPTPRAGASRSAVCGSMCGTTLVSFERSMYYVHFKKISKLTMWQSLKNDNWLGKQLQHCMVGFTHFTPHGRGSVLTWTNSIQREDNKTTWVAGSAAMRSLSVWHRGTLEMGIQIETKSKPIEI